MEYISVIIPVFKTEKYLPHCLESFEAQTYKNFEIVIVDDCSPSDLCREIVLEYSPKLRIEYIRLEKNGGIYNTRRVGIEKSKGDYVCFIDSDDFVEKDFLSSLLTAIRVNSADIAYCGAKLFYQETGVSKHFAINPLEMPKDLLLAGMISDAISCYIWNKLYKKSLAEKVLTELPNLYLNMFEDRPFVIACFYFSTIFVSVDQDLVNYRIHSDSTVKVSGKDTSSIVCAFNSFKVIKDFLARNELIHQYGHFANAAFSKLMNIVISKYLNDFSFPKEYWRVKELFDKWNMDVATFITEENLREKQIFGE